MTVKRDGRNRLRNYGEEYAKYGSSTKAKKDRAARNTARRQAIKKYGKEALQGKDIDHVTELKFAKDPKRVKTRITSTHINRGRSNAKTHKK